MLHMFNVYITEICFFLILRGGFFRIVSGFIFYQHFLEVL